MSWNGASVVECVTASALLLMRGHETIQGDWDERRRRVEGGGFGPSDGIYSRLGLGHGHVGRHWNESLIPFGVGM
jgi:phosphoglycerate dehydrogenase-like enzyme